MSSNPKARLSIDLPAELAERLSLMFAGLRWKNAAYEAITYGLVDVLESMTPRERRRFLHNLIKKRYISPLLEDVEEDE